MFRLLLPIAISLLAACQSTGPVRGSSIDAMPPAVGAVSYSGGDGTTIANAVVITAPNETVGVAAEYDWIRARYPGAKVLSTAILVPPDRGNDSIRNYDSIDIETRDGSSRTFYFDISSFFGKF